ncbi:MAG TPA: NADH-quinone oxidoreductase subunit L [Candidatus Cottocaccamicrobium excrementipullorum]|nr:NADH-quinone oxidoreductase subunit L [Candidatus Cottocaccamicrobium excrementipullorum]
MEWLWILIAFPALMAVIIWLIPSDVLKGRLVYVGAAGMMALTIFLLGSWSGQEMETAYLYVNTAFWDKAMLAGEVFFMGLIIYESIRHKKYPVMLLSIAQTGLMVWLESTVHLPELPHLMVDRLAILMCVIVAFVGGLICIYAVGYMEAYHQHHKEFQNRRGFFFAMIFFFLAAMMGLVLSLNMIWMYFFWEVTSVISFLLIGYTRTEEAVDNSFRALWMNLLGGLGFAAAIVISALKGGTAQLQEVVLAGSALPLLCLSLAGLTKSAQMPFSSWLLGAMVAPTPSSALLHSATMVKAGVYLLIRIAPALNGTAVGMLVALIGGYTFISASMMAIAQNDGKKVLAFSTISNLGLIVACAGIGVEETIWGAILLMIFHSVSKSMLFQAVGATENSLGSRDIENMHGLLLRLPKLAYIMGIGIAGMYLAPFGMLISKWVALKAFVDSGNVVLVIFLAYGSATTMLYWTKWLAKITSMHHTKEVVHDVTREDQYFSMYLHGGAMILLCLLFPVLATSVVNPIISQLFGFSYEVLSMSVLTTMAVMLASVILVPAAMFLITRSAPRDYVPIYMGGVNEGDNTYFTNSLGMPEHLYLTNWYLRFEFGMRRLMRPSEILTAGALVVMFCLIIGGAV